MPNLSATSTSWRASSRKREWFAGDEFTAADIQMSFPVEAARSAAASTPGGPS